MGSGAQHAAAGGLALPLGPGGGRRASNATSHSNADQNGSKKGLLGSLLESKKDITIPEGSQFSLDPTLVKAYAADFCGTPTLKEANRELVESFISHLATSARENRDALICKLTSYSQPMEVKS